MITENISLFIFSSQFALLMMTSLNFKTKCTVSYSKYHF